MSDVGRSLLVRAGAALLLIWLAALAGELLVFTLWPNEIMGWGERPALQPDDELGWRMIGPATTRLRWGGYDYVAISNSLGFPGPEPSSPPDPRALRILTLGGGFTSAEGVDTAEAWPRLLEGRLGRGEEHRPVEVFNAAVTGYGLDQHVILVRRFAAEWQPDLVLVALAPNDLAKVGSGIADRAAGIGFGRPQPDGAFAILTCQHLARRVGGAFKDLLRTVMSDRPDRAAWFYGQFAAFEVANRPQLVERLEAVDAALAAMAAACGRADSRLIVLLVPASIQICSPAQLGYFPDGVDLSDRARFDLEQPQRMLVDSLERNGVKWHDLRNAFRDSDDSCPYFAHNLHWTEDGHREIGEWAFGAVSEVLEGSN